VATKKIISSDFRNLAYARLIQATKKLVKQQEIKRYHSIFCEYLDLGIIERCDENKDESKRYIPHHAVIKNTSSTTKMRIVFDASARDENGLSLNDCLFEGPNLFPDLVGVIIRFRLYEYALCSDLEKAFLQIGINENDRDYLRFLWFEEINENEWPNGKVVSYRFKRVPFGLRSSPYILNKVIKHHIGTFKQTFPETVSCLDKNLYVDDFITSSETKEQLACTKDQSIHIFKEISMKMHKTYSNVPGKGMEESTKVLGITWTPPEDKLSLTFSFSAIRTKRELVSQLCGMFDPLGWFIPITNKLKLLVQQAWNKNLDWDQKIPEEMQSKIQECAKDVELVNQISINRWMNFSSQCTNVSIHAYCDASMQLYSSCIYLYFEKDNVQQSHLLCSKSRVAPRKEQTIPRLELQAALLSARLVNTIKRQFTEGDKLSIKCFSDSQVVLSWINNTSKVNKDFIQNRVNEIRDLTDISSWYYVASKSNPADIATKSLPASSWIFERLWWHGPDIQISKPTTFNEEKAEHDQVSVKNTLILDPVIEFSRFSNYTRLLKTAFYIYKFLHIINEQFNRQELEHKLIKLVQHEVFQKEVSDISQNKSVSLKSKLSQLQPFLDDKSILRVTGRLMCSDLKFDSKHPIILPKAHPFTTLLLKEIHEKNCHIGTSQMCSIVRQKFWILQCRRVCKRIVDSCIKCRRFKAKAFQPNFDFLPADRVQTKVFKPFDATGVDYLGPIALLHNNIKLYVLLFTCLQIRALHLELTVSLSANDFYKAFVRFISRRGTPSIIRSDNAKTFKSAAEKLQTTHGIEWKFNVQRAPWAGGVWERMVRTVKTSLRFIINSIPPTIQDFETHLCYIENIINSRPLTYTTGNDEALPLTPHNFLQSSAGMESSIDYNKSAKSIQTALNCSHKAIKSFWKRWKLEYLVLLNKNQNDKRASINIGDILLLNEGSKRQYWPLVKVTRLLKGRDGRVRSAMILHKGKNITRPIKLLYPLKL